MRSTHPVISRLSLVATLAVGMATMVPVTTFAQMAERLSDKDVKNLIDQVYDARDKFEGNLDNSVKNATVRTATTDVSVKALLQDLQDNANKLKERFNSSYSAGAEVQTLLKQSTGINTAMANAPGVTKGRSQWDMLASTLQKLATVYGTTFPLPDGAPVRRMNDGETAAAAASVAMSADQIKKQIGKEKSLTKADKTTGKGAADNLVKAANTLKSRIADGKPATGELKQVLDLTTSLEAFTAAHPVPSAAAPWSGVKGGIAKLRQSFGVPPTM